MSLEILLKVDLQAQLNPSLRLFPSQFQFKFMKIFFRWKFWKEKFLKALQQTSQEPTQSENVSFEGKEEFKLRFFHSWINLNTKNDFYDD